MWGTWIGLLATLVVASCDGGVQMGEAPTTTAADTTTTAAPTTTTSSPPARKATTRTTPRPRPATSLPALDEDIEITPEHVEPFLLDDIPGGWFHVPEEFSRKGPVDIDRAATEAAGDEPEAVAEVRALLERIGFLAGYDRRWDRAAPGPSRRDTSVTVALFVFATSEGADAFLKFRADVYGAVDGLDEIYFPEPPNARAWVGGSHDGASGGVVVCAYDGFLFEIVSETDSGPVHEHRQLVEDFADWQHERLRAALE